MNGDLELTGWCDQCQALHLTRSGSLACCGHRGGPNGTQVACGYRRRRNRLFCADCDPEPDSPTVGSRTKALKRRLNGTPLGPIGGTAVRDPLERLARLAGQIDDWMGKLMDRVAELETIGNERGRPHAAIAALHSSMRLLGDLLVAINRLDLDERMIRLDRLQADQMRELLDVVARDEELGLTEAQLRVWPRAFARAARHRVLDVVDAEEVA